MDIKQQLSDLPASQQTFQLEITQYSSRRAYLTLNTTQSANTGQNGQVMALTDQPVTLREV
jgi:hypothetical protein